MNRHWLFALLVIASIAGCNQNPYQEGKALYEQKCQNCHQQDGNGVGQLIPPLNKADYLVSHQEKLPCIIKFGMEGEVVVNDTVYNRAMPANERLTDFEIANIINYINHAWENDLPFRSPEWVKKQLEECAEEPLRHEE